jgi:hypothetical protein
MVDKITNNLNYIIQPIDYQIVTIFKDLFILS